jgi:hypothetical protein
MRSIPWVMTLDFLRRGRWMLPSLALLANAMPLLLLTALRASEALNPSDSSHITMHIVLTQMSMWIFGVAIISSMGPVSKMYALPVTTTTIVVWRLLLLAGLAFTVGALNTLLINVLFDVDWPVWGPALLLAAALALAQASVWYADKSIWCVVALALLALGYGAWMRSRYGSFWSPPSHYWREISLGDAAVMLGMLALALLVGVAGVARGRRGEPPLSLGLLEGLQRWLDGMRAVMPPFHSPVAAQFWYEWRRKGWMMPAGAAFGLAIAFAAWLAFSRDPGDLWEGIFGLGGCLTILGFVAGMIIGHQGPSDVNFDLGSFFATRPLTTTTLANTLLKACGLSVLLAWTMWALAFVGVYAALRAMSVPTPLLPNQLQWWFYPATLLGPWIAATLLGCIGLSGRIRLFIEIGGGLLGAWIALTLFGQFALSDDAQALLRSGSLVALGVACVVGSLVVYARAWRQGLIEWPAVYIAGSLWIALCLAAWFAFGQPLSLMLLASYALTCGLLALALAPLAAAPLALDWNRTR